MVKPPASTLTVVLVLVLLSLELVLVVLVLAGLLVLLALVLVVVVVLDVVVVVPLLALVLANITDLWVFFLFMGFYFSNFFLHALWILLYLVFWLPHILIFFCFTQQFDTVKKMCTGKVKKNKKKATKKRI